MLIMLRCVVLCHAVHALGYHFGQSTDYFPDLAALIGKHSSFFLYSHRDPSAPVIFNVSGRKFESRVGLVG
jgi:hypothetical protein